MQLESLKELSESEINGILVEVSLISTEIHTFVTVNAYFYINFNPNFVPFIQFFKKQGLQPQFTLKFHSNTTLRRENPV